MVCLIRDFTYIRFFPRSAHPSEKREGEGRSRKKEEDRQHCQASREAVFPPISARRLRLSTARRPRPSRRGKKDTEKKKEYNQVLDTPS